MSHIHLPDGILPLWLVLLGWAATALAVAAVLWYLRRNPAELSGRIARLGVVAAVMMVGMSLEVVPIAYHFNLSVLAGILLGPAAGFLAAFLVVLMLALFGHGGITVVGLNALVIGTEVVLGSLLFRAVSGARRLNLFWGAFIATVVALAVSTTLMVGIIGIARINPAEQAPRAAITFSNPFQEGLFRVELLKEEGHEPAELDLPTFAGVVYTLGIVGWALEGLLTGLIVRYLGQVRPDLLPVRRTAP
nr:cobalt uptake substrate-specific transmembrane region [uncultured bacterium]